MNRSCYFRWPAQVLLAGVIAVTGACSSGGDTPEDRVRALIVQGETAAEKKETGVLRRLVSEKYSDSQGQDKKAIESILRYTFLRHESIHLFTRIRQVTVPAPGSAEAIVLVAMAGQPISGPEEFERMRADLHRFDLGFSLEDGEWKVIRAEWRRAEFADFL